MKRKLQKTPYDKINDLTINWIYKMRAMDARISGPMLQEAALYFAQKTFFQISKPPTAGWMHLKNVIK